MNYFMIDCDAVTSIASSINSLVAQFSQISDSVKGYDTNCEDGFDFAGAKSAIAANIDVCTIKVQNTVKLIESVVAEHTALQNGFTLDQGDATDDSENKNKVDTSGNGTFGTNDSTDNDKSSENDTSSLIGGMVAGGYAGGSLISGSGNTDSSISEGHTGGGYTGGYTGGYAAGAGVASGVAGSITSSIPSKPSAQNSTDLTKKVNNISQVSVDVDKLDPANKTPIVMEMTYNDLGYATYDNKYVIVCDTTMGNVGDNIVFTKPDGTKIDCIVGAVVDYSQDYKGTVSFIVNNQWNVQGNNNLTFDLNNIKILNNGKYVK